MATYHRSGAELGRLADVFGDPTRRAIYRHLRESKAPITASEMGETFGLHRTVARAHLEKLTELGLVESGKRHRAGGGRPAKTYAYTGERLEIMLPPRRYERLARFLMGIIDEHMSTDAACDAAFTMGRMYGEDLAQQLNGADAPESLPPAAVVGWLDAAGYDVTLDGGEPRGRGLRRAQLRVPRAGRRLPAHRVLLRPRPALRHARRRPVAAPPGHGHGPGRRALPARVPPVVPCLRGGAAAAPFQRGSRPR